MAIEEYVGLYCVNLEWAGDMRFVVVTSRPRFANKKDVPRGEENYAVTTYMAEFWNAISSISYIIMGKIVLSKAKAI